jgi:glyoxylase-like metal-dependent hydrolase (beta-lactamase superfamily II)
MGLVADNPYDWISHGEGVWSKRYKALDLNVGVVECDGGLAVIDTRAHHAQARELKNDLSRISSLPVRWVVNTHHHWDHTFGNAEFTGAAIWGHARCAETLRETGDRTRRELMDMLPDHGSDFREVAISPPTFTLTDHASVTFGGRTLQLRHLGRGHTDNDIVVSVVDAGVTFAGDLVEEGAPPSFGDSFPLEWPDTVTALLGVMGDHAIPGHGSPVDRHYVASQRDDLASVATLAAERRSEGRTPGQAARAGGPFPEETLEAAFERAWPALTSGSGA